MSDRYSVPQMPHNLARERPDHCGRDYRHGTTGGQGEAGPSQSYRGFEPDAD